MAPLKIIVVATTIAPELGGIARSVPTLAESVAQAGAEVILLALGRPPFTQEFDAVHSARKEVYDSRSALLVALKAHLVSAKKDVIVHHAGIWTFVNLMAHRIAKKLGAKIVCSPRSMLDPWALQHRFLKKKLAWWLYAKQMLRETNAIHVTSELERKNVECLQLGRPIILVPNGICFPPQKIEPTIGSGAVKRCLFLSRLSQKKGLSDLLSAFAEVNHPHWVLDVVGNAEGNEGENAKLLVKSLGISERVNFLGFREGDKKWKAYQNSDLFVLPTYSENFGLVVGEAMACGLPVITTTAAPWDVLNQIDAGWSIDVGPQNLAKTLIVAFSSSPDRLRSMGSRGQSYVYEHFSWERIGKSMLNAYANL